MKRVDKQTARRILDWCIDNYGKSLYHKTFPRLYCVTKDKRIKHLGAFSESANRIYLYMNKIEVDGGIPSLIKVIIHEYTHYLQPTDGSYEILNRELGYENNTFEIEAWKAANRDWYKCKTDLGL